MKGREHVPYGHMCCMFKGITMKSASHAYRKISKVIERLEQNPYLYMVEHFIERMQAIDVLELQLLDGAGGARCAR